jgi:threonine/homoserine/homoserine lactone efflux protein
MLLVALGVVMALKARAQPDTAPGCLPGGGKRSFLAGVLISAFNPALISSWILFSSTVFTGADLAGAFAAATGVFLGTFGWFAGLAWGADRFRRHPFLRSPWVPRVLGSLLAVYGAVLVVPPLVDAMLRA